MTIPELFQNLPAIQDRLDGWCVLDKSFTLASIVIATRPDVCLEIGLWKGKSFSAMALACKAVNHGICIGVDPWSREVAVREQTSDNDRKWWGDIDFDAVHREFMANMAALDIDKFIRIERKESRHFDPPPGLGLVSVDGSHSETAMHDMVRIAPKVIMGGFVVTDDSDWTGGGVSRGERRLVEMGFKKLFCIGTGAVFLKVR